MSNDTEKSKGDVHASPTLGMLFLLPVEKAPNEHSAKSNLLNLPRHVRDEIYSLALKADYKEIQSSNRGGDHASASTNLSILRLCRQINKEATPVLYQENYFRMAMKPLRSSLEYPRTIDTIQSVRVTLCLDDPIYQGCLGQLLRLGRSGSVRKSCHVDVMSFSWAESRLMSSIVEIMAAALSSFQVVAIRVAEAAVYSGTGRALLFARHMKQRRLICEALQQVFRQRLGTCSVKVIGQSEVLVFRPRRGKIVMDNLGNRRRDVVATALVKTKMRGLGCCLKARMGNSSAETRTH